ncbi:18967_t:CDS:2, partial [Racocetra persica]
MEDHIEISINDKDHLITESTLFTTYAAISQDESFIAVLDNKKNKELAEEHSVPLTSTKFTDLMKSDEFSSWFVAVSNEHQEKFRLIAISCISNNDMQDLQDQKNPSRCGFTKIWMIRSDFENFDMECKVEIDDGGIIQFLFETDEFTLVLLKGNGIYKHRLWYSSVHMQFRHEILAFHYSERIINALKYNCSESVSMHFITPSSDVIRKYLLRCLNSHYLLVDTFERDPDKNIELYDLRTNQLINVFKRNKVVLSILDRERPGAFAVSGDEKLLAYASENDIKIYMIENGLDLSSLSFESGIFTVKFIKFVFDNEKLLIFKNDRTAAVWDIFNTIREFIEFIPLEKNISPGLIKSMTRIVIGPISENDSFIILNIRPYFEDDQIVWDNLILSEHLRRSDPDSGWKELDPSESIFTESEPHAYDIDGEVVLLSNLNDSELKYYQRIEPWAAEKLKGSYGVRSLYPRYVVYLDKKKQVRLFIGNNTIQVWSGKKLEFIRIVNDNSEEPEEPYEKFKIIKVKYGVRKFDLLISKEGKNIQIKIEHEDDVIYILRNAIDTLVYLDGQSNKSVNLATGNKQNLLIKYILFAGNYVSPYDKFEKLSSTRSKIVQKRPLHSWLVPLKDLLPDK